MFYKGFNDISYFIPCKIKILLTFKINEKIYITNIQNSHLIYIYIYMYIVLYYYLVCINNSNSNY